MKSQKLYEADDTMITIIRDNYNILQSLGSFGISLGFGDKTVREVCEAQGVDTYTFLAVVNFTINGFRPHDDTDRLDVPTLLRYLKASHVYFLDFQLPFIRRELVDAINPDDHLAPLILKLYDEYAQAIKSHMRYEEKNVFPYVERLMDGQVSSNYDILTYSRHHGQTDQKLRELKTRVMIARESMRQQIEAGASFAEALETNRRLGNENADVRIDALRELKEILAKGDRAGAKRYMVTINAALQQMGIEPLKTPPELKQEQQ